MTDPIIELPQICLGILAVLVVVDFVRTRRAGLFALELGLLAAAFVVLPGGGFALWSDTGNGRAFGPGENPWPMIGLVFACILLGMAARYFFYLKGAFSWLSLLKPICVSPIVLLPLLGTLQDGSHLEPLQVVSFCVLAFQNGFFWRVIFERAQSGLDPK